MLNSLIRLFDDSNLEVLENRLSAGLDRLKKTFGACFTSLEDKGEYYELVLDVADDAKASNVNVEFDDETRELSVEYKYEAKNYNTSSTVVETLPANADEDTISAHVEDGKLTITVEKKEEAEEEPEEQIDEREVRVNRKNRK